MLHFSKCFLAAPHKKYVMLKKGTYIKPIATINTEIYKVKKRSIILILVIASSLKAFAECLKSICLFHKIHALNLME